MKNVSLKGLCLIALALLSIGQGIQAKSTELENAKKKYNVALRALKNCTTIRCPLVHSTIAKRACGAALCPEKQTRFNYWAVAVKRLEKKQN